MLALDAYQKLIEQMEEIITLIERNDTLPDSPEKTQMHKLLCAMFDRADTAANKVQALLEGGDTNDGYDAISTTRE